jgi:GNAT superfamily N-acetyltransferase
MRDHDWKRSGWRRSRTAAFGLAGGWDMVALVDYDPDAHEAALRALWTAYLEESAVPLREAGYEEDVPTVVAADLAGVGQFQPPHGRLLLAVDDGVTLGCGALRVIAPGVAEVKRMYLRLEARGRGIGRVLLQELLATARRFGCREARLDTGWFMTDAHRLYRAAGFQECAPYAESEVPVDFDPRWKYMRLDLNPELPGP